MHNDEGTCPTSSAGEMRLEMRTFRKRNGISGQGESDFASAGACGGGIVEEDLAIEDCEKGEAGRSAGGSSYPQKPMVHSRRPGSRSLAT